MVLTESNNVLKKGSPAPKFKLQATDEKEYSISDFPDAKLYLIVFMCNHCPYVQDQLHELNKLNEKYKSQGLVLIGINANESENYPEDSFENMQHMVSEGDIKFLYLHDPTQITAKDYGAVCTPDPFLFDKNKKLIFHSKVQDMKAAIEEYLEKGTITLEDRPSIGCSIKWK
jgi:peroxiredoxin